MPSLAPIALFVYNRPDHTRRTISHLQQNHLATESDLVIYADAARFKSEQKNVSEVRDIISNVSGFKSVHIVTREKNMGLAASIIDGVTKLVNQYGKVIVFEDDLLSAPYTLKYFNDALTRFADEEQVMHIGGYMYPLDTNGLPQTFFYRAATSWGWATWARAWKNFEPDIDKLISEFDKQKINSFSIDGTMNFWKQMKEFKAGKNNSWAIRWYASIFLKGGLTLNPSHSLIQNIGHDGTGVHSNAEAMYNVEVSGQPVTHFPSAIKEDLVAYTLIKHFLTHRKGSLLKRALRFFRQKF
ncbi:glycosyltransferase [Mucilaginibacter ginkgonis]|uniref:Glycosyltransferase n=1 Tax=Mucilaginibacter ginkgonis TaxID=2682091 RepID=A0A6I4I4F7_9SPHI|nr:glycosyltransferase [Mucilaginibacter ginkgonis]QQL48886.1 glycosyltransferase [Mucilaginibacter ginkgonis]